MRVVKSVPVEEIVCRGSIKDSDVSRLSRAFVSDQHLSEQDADTLFAMTVACPVQAPSWNRFFVDTLTGYVLRQMEPEGYVTAEKAAWLQQRIVSGGRVRSSIEFHLLMSVIERARWVPISLAALALEEIKAAVVNGDGPLRAGKVTVHGIILDAEVDLLRSVICAFGRGSSLPMTRTEAEVLFDISAATAASVPPAAWTEFYVQAVTNLALSSAGFAAASREQVLKAEVGKRHVDAPIETQIEHILMSVRADYRRQSQEERALSRLERQRIEIVTNEDLDMGDSAWVAERLLRGRRRSPVEIAVVAHLYRECLLSDDVRAPLQDRDGQAA
jgi:hypothetical protein